jgi:hypothetical protein
MPAMDCGKCTYGGVRNVTLAYSSFVSEEAEEALDRIASAVQ